VLGFSCVCLSSAQKLHSYNKSCLKLFFVPASLVVFYKCPFASQKYVMHYISVFTTFEVYKPDEYRKTNTFALWHPCDDSDQANLQDLEPEPETGHSLLLTTKWPYMISDVREVGKVGREGEGEREG
jgi:hypothetical protein